MTQIRIGQADHDAGLYERVRIERRFDLRRIDIHAAADDQIRPAVNDVQIAIIVQIAEITQRLPFAAQPAFSARG